MEKIPVILDTDIGFDIDDLWALVMMLKSPELDIKLIATDTGNTYYRTKIVAKTLELAHRTDIPIGVGIPLSFQKENQIDWVEDYDLSRYPGEVIEDGVGAIIDTIMRSEKKVSLISIAPVPNIAAALQREPRIVNNARFIGMHGSIRKGYLGASSPDPEFNVFQAAKSCQMVFEADWPITITPLDTCGIITLKGDHYQAILNSEDPLLKAIVSNYFIWKKNIDWPKYKDLDPNTVSSVLYDCVAVYLAFSEELLEIEELPLRITDDGRTIIDDRGKKIRCATSWKDQDKFEDFLRDRLLH
ncbi:MAG: nucleoside hydrolase [SAR324 cluster bacterium]|nr:nucleoside hydrolase [SAR324 cluster bacterium]